MSKKEADQFSLQMGSKAGFIYGKHKIEIARNQWGYISIIDGRDLSYCRPTFWRAVRDAQNVANGIFNVSGAGDERGSSYTNPHVV